MTQLVAFTVDDFFYALPLDSTERVIRSVRVTPVPKAPDVILGIVNVRGQIVPVVNVRRRFGLPDQAVDIGNHFVLARTQRRSLVLVTDSVVGIVERSEEDVIAAQRVLPGLEYLQGVARLEDGMILIHDIDKCLSLEEEDVLDQALGDVGATDES
jgi:purine-binding chemotaxis protein CheW